MGPGGLTASAWERVRLRAVGGMPLRGRLGDGALVRHRVVVAQGLRVVLFAVLGGLVTRPVALVVAVYWCLLITTHLDSDSSQK